MSVLWKKAPVPSLCLLVHMLVLKLIFGASLVVQMVKNLPAMQETGVRSLGLEDPLQKGMVTTPVSLA